MKTMKSFYGPGHRTTNALSAILMGVVLTLLQPPQPALAHKVSIFAWVEGETVHTQSNFFGGKKVRKAPVEVYDTSGNLLLDGVTDDNGEFSFKAPVKGAMKIVVSAGMGHQAEWRLKPSDFESAGQTASQAATGSSRETGPPPMPDPVPEPANHSTEKTALTADEVRGIVEKALDEKLSPVMRTLAELRDQGPSVRDVLGGIGYIIGLAGIAAYMLNRRKKETRIP